MDGLNLKRMKKKKNVLVAPSFSCSFFQIQNNYLFTFEYIEKVA